MATRNLTKSEFDEVTQSDGIVLVDFWAEWCGPCKRFAPVYERASEEYPDITFGKVDTDAEQDLAAEYGIQSIPTIMAIRDGVLVYQQAGSLPASALTSLITQVKALDMEAIKQKAETANGRAAA
jgi:thioredoxin 1